MITEYFIYDLDLKEIIKIIRIHKKQSILLIKTFTYCFFFLKFFI
jgi:hypothetical protein